MISEEKLLNGYIGNRNKELQAEWYKACEYHGFDMEHCNGKYDATPVSHIEKGKVHFTHNLSVYGYNKKKLTLDDFKTKTRTEYKLVTMRDYEALKEFHEGKEFYHNTNDYKLVTNPQTLIQSYQHKSLYTKEEVELDWRDVAAGCLGFDMVNPGFYYSNGKYLDFKGKYIGVLLGCDTTIDQFLRMCHEVAEMTEKPE